MIDTFGSRTSLPAGVAHSSTARTNDKIRSSAQQFEAVLLSNMFQSLQDSVSSFSAEEEDPSAKTFNELGIQQLATAAADAGGIGISQIVAKYLEHQSAPKSPESSPLKLSHEMPIYELHWQNSEVLGK